ncbi:MAG: nucleotidyltransferase family protein [Candidatus Woesearchaeota archaeon]|jgi:NDP-sugar pyrophosphorylase family protein|nr:nucleotidyltransferase family protein [Candidatus Woesearchaeota archaeon]MDP7506038.1 nucleotidyltransferase family protein [Candidatus Woesearchaeota archaeon]|tara:strand:- start:477 stop:1322 length:846 start_codon:yes stop_codon:yes gene_type:complete
MKERVTLTLDSNILKTVDKNVDGFKIKNRSHAIELLLLRAMGANVPKKAVILAGGKGTRLRPITYEIPKGLIPIDGKTITQYLLDLLKKFGINEVILSVGYMKEKIMDYFGDGSKFGVSIKYIEEDEPLGTAGPLKMAKHLLNETFIVSNGDELKDINIEEMYALHKQNNALITIALTTVSDPSKYGVARLSGSKILEFIEKPKKEDAPSNLINSGFYIIEPEVIEMIPKGFAMLEKEIFPRLAKEGRLVGYPFSGYWSDIGTIEKYDKVIKDVKEGKYKI